MSLLPKSRTARRRLMTVAVAAPVLGLAVGVSLYAMRGAISFFYTPSQAEAAHVPPGRDIQLGGACSRGADEGAADINPGAGQPVIARPGAQHLTGPAGQVEHACPS